MNRFFRFLLTVAVLLFAFKAFAQEPKVLVQMQKQSRYTAQILLIDKQFPDQQFISYTLQNYRLMNYDPRRERYAMVLSQGSGQLHDSRTHSVDFPEERVAALLENKILIKHLKHTGEEWELVAAESGRLEDQDITVSPELPAELLEKRQKAGYTITSISSNPVYWALIFTKTHTGADPIYFTGKDFPVQDVKLKAEAGYEITAMHYNKHQRQWLVGMQRPQEGKDIRLWAGDQLPEGWIEERWLEGYQITYLHHNLPVKQLIQNSNVRLFRAFHLGLPHQQTDAQYLVKLYPNHPIGLAAMKGMLADIVKTKNWGAAINFLNQYKPAFPDYAQVFDERIALFEQQDESPAEIERLGSGVNTRSQEYKPVPSADGRKLYFTGLDRPGGKGGEDLFVSEWQGVEWGPATSVSDNINQANGNESMTSVSADGLRISYFGQGESMLSLGDNYYSIKQKGGWSEPMLYPPPIQGPYFESDALLSSDGRALLFVSTRPGGVGKTYLKGELSPTDGFGNTDIYVCLKEGNSWSAPINLGTTLNTPFAERTPFLHPDGKTMYFSSGGHNSIGGVDVFKTERLSTTDWTKWSKPVNLGKQINTHVDDWGYKITTDGQFAYYAASASSGNGAADIFRVRLPEVYRPEPVATIRGTITDTDGNPLDANLIYENLSNQVTVGELRSDPQTGKYFIAIPLGKNYGYTAEKQGYYPVSRSIDLTKRTTALDTIIDIQMVSIEQIKTGTSITINNVFFDFDKSTLKPASRSELDRLTQFLKDNPALVIEVSGHTDNKGSASYNAQLSQERAESVRQFLIDKGIVGQRLKAKGYGFAKPIAPNDTPQGRAKNRRVEFRVLNR